MEIVIYGRKLTDFKIVLIYLIIINLLKVYKRYERYDQCCGNGHDGMMMNVYSSVEKYYQDNICYHGYTKM